jgi:hypothetical protein
MGQYDERERPVDPGRPEHAVIDRIQRMVDDLGAALALPVSIDDHNFRLQFYSPQLGMVDRVRVESILFRDSPEPAKSWVRSHGVAAARGPVLVPASEELGLLPRVCIPIPHDDVLLGYLWIIDAEGTLTESGRRRATDTAASIAPLMFRRLFLERLDRASERSAMAQLVDERPEIQRQGFAALHASQSGGILPARIVIVQVRTQVRAQATGGTEEPGDAEAIALTLEVALETARGSVTPNILHLLRQDDRAVVLLSQDAARRAMTEDGAGERLVRWLAERLEHDDIVLGVGRLAESAEAIRRSYEEARDAVEVARRTSRGRTMLTARWLGPHRVLLGLSTEELRAIADDALGPILEERSGTLLETLEAFLDAGGDVVSVATALDLHRSSVYPRLQRLETLLDADLSDGQVRFALQHALIALQLASGPS